MIGRLDEKDLQSQPEHYPSKLSHGSIGDPKKFAFLISGRDEKRSSTQGQVLSQFLKHRIKIVSQWGYLDDQRNEFVLCLCCDMKNADITPDGLVVELRLIKSVRNARSVSLRNRLFHGYLFPMTLLENRVVVLDSQITFLIEQQLCKSPELKESLAEVGRIYALDIVRQIRSKLPADSGENTIRENVLDYFTAAGIGRFSLLDTDVRSVQAVVRDPPLSERGEATGNHFIHGIIVGLIESLSSRETTVVEDLYDPKSGRLFVALLDKRNVSTLDPKTRRDVKTKALQEVEKVISSIEGTEEQRNPTPLITAGSQVTLNQVLKAYGDEGWVGGKIGYVPESGKEPSVVVAKYKDGQLVEEKPESKTTTQNEMPSNSEVMTRRRITKGDQDEEDEDLANALKSIMGQDSVYFEDSNLF